MLGVFLYIVVFLFVKLLVYEFLCMRACVMYDEAFIGSLFMHA